MRELATKTSKTRKVRDLLISVQTASDHYAFPDISQISVTEQRIENEQLKVLYLKQVMFPLKN